jgi:hypothetical protein
VEVNRVGIRIIAEKHLAPISDPQDAPLGAFYFPHPAAKPPAARPRSPGSKSNAEPGLSPDFLRRELPFRITR